MYNLYFKDGTLFSTDFERVVHGGRGDYIELTKEQIVVGLESKFGNKLPEFVSDENFYYFYLLPKGREEKIYWQVKTVSYADYKIGYYYISPEFVQEFREDKRIFKSLFT